VWAEKRPASDKSSYIYIQEMWSKEPREEREGRVWEPLKDTGRVIARREREDDGEYCEESWQWLKRRTIMLGKTRPMQQNPEATKFWGWNPESSGLESRIYIGVESGIH